MNRKESLVAGTKTAVLGIYPSDELAEGALNGSASRGAVPAYQTGSLRPGHAGAFPLAAKYHPQWIRDNALGQNTLCQVESLVRHLPLRAGMRVLDLGCGKGTSSIFMAREFGIEAWAVDQATCPTEIRERAIDLGCEGTVFPLTAEAHSLPFARKFFDAVIAIDSFHYFGTDERYLEYVMQFIKPGGWIGVVDIAFTRELRCTGDAPEYLRQKYPKHWSFVHTAEWWKQHWEKTGLVDMVCAELLPDSADLLRNYVQDRPPEQDADCIMQAVPQDHTGLIALVCLVARKR